jgi:protein-disulfide isomerase
MNAAKRPNRNDAREKARQQAKSLSAKSSARDKRGRLLTQIGLGVAAITVIGILAAVILEGTKPAGPGPLNMASDGIKIGAEYKAVKTDALPADAKPVATPENPSDIVDITIFVDYICPICGEFEAVNGGSINDLVSRGSATIEIHPLSFLDNRSQGTQYSTRAANAVACLANYVPDSVLEFNNLLFANQPTENTSGLSDEQLIQLAQQTGANEQATACIEDQDFKSWVAASTARAMGGTLAINNLDPSFTKISGTPTVLINGVPFQYSYPFNNEEFLSAVLAAAGQ